MWSRCAPPFYKLDFTLMLYPTGVDMKIWQPLNAFGKKWQHIVTFRK
jgi:hypothetical protein